MLHNLNTITTMSRDRLAGVWRRARRPRVANMTRDAREGRNNRRVNWRRVGFGILIVAVLIIWLILIPR